MSNDILEQVKNSIPAEIRMISGCKDEQTSADVSNVSSFQLPDPAGRAGGALTSSLLKVVYADEKAPDDDLSYQDVLLQVRDILSSGRYTQIPQLSSSRPLDISHKFDITPDNFNGTKRAVLIGINYIGQQGELSGCHNDIMNIKKYIQDVHGFEEENITILMDDGEHVNPTRDNILNAYRTLVASCVDGDCVYCHYSGHGGKLRDDNGDEADGYDETLVPVDYASAGQIRDDALFTTLVGAFRAGVTATFVMDCCHSGTVLDLPFVFVADGEHTQMETPPDFDMSILMGLAQTLMSEGGAEGGGAEDALAAAAAQCCTIL